MKRTRNGNQGTVKRARKTGPKSFKTALQRASATRETHYVDTSFTPTFDTTGFIDLVNPIPEGAGVDERVGKKIILKSLQCRGMFVNGTGTNKNAFIIVYDKKPRESLPLVNQILTAAQANALNNDDNSSRFSILKRIDFVSAPDGGNGAGSAHLLDFFLDLKGLPMEYTNTVSGGILGIETGAIYVLAVGSQANGAATGSSPGVFFRTRFVDI